MSSKITFYFRGKSSNVCTGNPYLKRCPEKIRITPKTFPYLFLLTCVHDGHDLLLMYALSIVFNLIYCFIRHFYRQGYHFKCNISVRGWF